MKVKVWWEGDFVNTRGEDVIEISDDATEAQIEAEVRDFALEHFSWGHEIIKEAHS